MHRQVKEREVEDLVREQSRAELVWVDWGALSGVCVWLLQDSRALLISLRQQKIKIPWEHTPGGG